MHSSKTTVALGLVCWYAASGWAQDCAALSGFSYDGFEVELESIV